MKIIPTIPFCAALAGILLAGPLVIGAQLEVITNTEPQRVFFGPAVNIPVSLHNPGDQNFDAEIRTRILQTSSATAVLLSETPWKRLQIPAGETVLASAALTFPAVKAETRFFVQWLASSNQIIGRTEVWVYPTNLLAELKPLAADEALGVFDPQNQLKPLLKNLKIGFVNLENSELEDFLGKLAIIGPFRSKLQMPDGLANRIRTIAKKGTATVWIKPPPEKRGKLLPSFYFVVENTNAVVVVQTDLVCNLPESPQSQLNLLRLCKLALNPEPISLTDSAVNSNQP
jgi:hypothetical protein